MKKIIATLGLVMAAAAFSTATFAAEPPASYQSSCFACHFSGAAGAPKTGDPAAWEPRLAKGMDVLVMSVRNGMGAMPPTGMCPSCSNEEYQELIEFMAAPAQEK
ncbi:MAG: cytochrome c5 family protein [Halioglobus sp.]